MLYYLSSIQNSDVFNFLEEETGLIIKSKIGEFHLSKYIHHEMMNLSHVQYFAFDLNAIKDSEDALIETIRAMKLLYNFRIIVFASGIKPGNPLLIRLIKEKIYNIITGDTQAEIKREVLKSVTADGFDHDDSVRLTSSDPNAYRKQYRFKNKDIKIAVIGVHERAGVTNVAFNISNFLALSGAKVSYTEAKNGQSDLELVAKYYEFDNVSSEQFKYKNVDYYKNMKYGDDYNIQVFDLGCISNKMSFEVFKAFDIRILVCGSKPYEISYLDVIPNIKDYYTHLLLNYSAEQGRIKLRLLERENLKVHFLEYAPSLFNEGANGQIYLKIFENYIEEL